MAIKSIINFIKTIQEFPRDEGYEYYYRGHSNFNFSLLPSIYRKPKKKKVALINNEEKIFREIIIRTPADFSSEKTTIEKLVKMQHYGLPTRILDITSNPLVALYFACAQNSENKDGEVVVIKIPKEETKFYDSDTVSVLSNLARRTIDFDISEILEEFKEREKHSPDNPDNIMWFNKQEPIPYLLHEIKDEKPQFLPIIYPSDFNRVLLVRVKLNNNRILKQSGAFLLFGINNKKSEPAQVPNSWILNKSLKDFDFKISNDRKTSILKDLDSLGINDSTLYPELEQQAKYIKQIYEG
ncbi:MAG: FRG domain-containing protein [Bacteroidota bacterium]